MTDYAYAPGGVLDTIGSAVEVAHRLAVLDIWSGNEVDFVANVPSWPDVYEVAYVGSALDEYQRKSGETHDGVVGGKWQITESYADIPTAEAKDRLKARVGTISQTGVDIQGNDREMRRLMLDALDVLREGIVGLAETTAGTIGWGSDHGAWPAPAQTWDVKQQAIATEIADVFKIKNIVDVEDAKLAEIDALADMTAVRAYDAEADWPVSTIPPP